MKIEIQFESPSIFVLTFDSQYDLCMSFLRIQEFYESPVYHGRYFTLEDYMDYWSKEYGQGSFNYLDVWNGFNVPGSVIKKWIEI